MLGLATGLDEKAFDDIVAPLRQGGANVDLVRRPPEGPYASFEWLIPTAVILLLLRPYLQAFSTETGKLHAKALHDGLSRLWGKVFGPKPDIAVTVIGTAGKVGPAVFSRTVSLKAVRNDGGQVTLLFPTSASVEDFVLAADQFIRLMETHYTLEGTDPLTGAMSLVGSSSRRKSQALLYMNPGTQHLELVDYVESSKQRKLITYPIPV